MPDWNALVRERLNLTELSPAQQDEITAELASHLDELCEKYRKQGLSESEAVTRAILEVTDWQVLSKRIQRAKHEEGSMTDRTMNDRIRRLWIPGLASTAIALVLPAASLMVLTRIGTGLPSYSHFVISVWPLDAILGGAAGAYLSRRAAGAPTARLASALFPVAVLVIAICFVSGFVALAHILFGAYQSMPWILLGRPLGLLVLHSTLLLLGALPFLRHQRKFAESGVRHG
jgi:hypothetical protein